ncbi:hypothetical protein CDAR_402651 [Caerostris darwini]|uniref:Uncharacterized protein n=1 Tax=Caerostris darwini TaxID=1538125 RepID=A0AAV4U443_9ARAC|nr:hypothetical protein CDAR_402651 [Caerostris darwini]
MEHLKTPQIKGGTFAAWGPFKPISIRYDKSCLSPSLKQCNENKVGRKEIEIKWGDETSTEGMNSIWRGWGREIFPPFPSRSKRDRISKRAFWLECPFLCLVGEETLLINIVAFGLRHSGSTEWWVGRVLMRKIFSTLNSFVNTLGISNVYLKYFDIF